jgi:phytoene dehydrogenase-like protein
MTDAIVIGAGVNGLTAASYLARAGMKVLVLEKRSSVGGLASTYEFAPGFRASMGPDNCGLLLPGVVSELELERHGLELMTLDPVAFVPAREGKGLLLWREPGKTREEIRPLSARDAEAYPRFAELVERLSGFLRPLLSKPAPLPEIKGGSDLLQFLRLGWGFRQLGARSMHELLRVLPMALEDFLSEWFENGVLKAALGGPALESLCLGPRSPGTSALFLYQRIGPRTMARGGAGGVSQALAASFASLGGVVRTEAPVKKIRIEGGSAKGVVLENGEEIPADLVLSALAPRTTFHELGDPTELPPGFLSEIDNLRYRGVAAKLNLALSELPVFRCRPGKEPGAHHRAVIQIGDSLDDVERAYDASKYGTFSERPLLSATIPSLLDRSLAPEGKHVMSVVVQYAPYRLRGTSWAVAGRKLAGNVLDLLNERAPNLKNAVLHQHLWTPEDYERELALPEGNWHQGEMALDQMFFMRPVPGWSRYETPLSGLYLCGAATHPGGGITGAPGYNAARRVLKTRR